MRTSTSLGSIVASLLVAGGLVAGIGQAHAASSIMPVHTSPLVQHAIPRILPDPTCTGNCKHAGPLAELIVSLAHFSPDPSMGPWSPRIVPDPTCPTCLRNPFGGLVARLAHVRTDLRVLSGHAHIVPDPRGCGAGGCSNAFGGQFGRMGGDPPIVVDSVPASQARM